MVRGVAYCLSLSARALGWNVCFMLAAGSKPVHREMGGCFLVL